MGVATDLCEEKSALDAGHSGSGERRGVGVFAQFATGSHAVEAVAQVCFPALEAGGNRSASDGVAFCELPGERPDRTAAASSPLDLMLNHCVKPTVDTSPGVQVVEEHTLPVEDCVGGDVDDRVDEVIAVFEVMIELATARTGAFPDIIEAHAGDALLSDQLGCRLHNPFARRAALRCRGFVGHVRVISALDLTVQLDPPRLDYIVQ
jgi:hypothetical protein